ncbi:hypothetical protein F3Y22_tig00111758pilonHSYRG00362 [Hibiscus syriacus]|uniref:Uncharacterized protein n=1 Tax=Hibiscus syriacus TaxID=106335 RepID=A0A6A2XG69_HIBSY|nr:hypothetical protein F3Y22_tig00111758pilonHSYRG00362 [Hibiscus syriacus]
MNEENEYYMNLHVGGKFVRNPYVRYVSERVAENVIDDVGLDDIGDDVAAEGERDIDVTGGGGGEGVQESENINEDYEESDSEEQNAYNMDVSYLSDGEGDNELKYARENNKGKKHVDEENDSELYDEEVDEGGNIEVTEDVGGNDTDYYDSDDHGSLIRSDDDEHEEGVRRRGIYPIYNPDTERPHFCLGCYL